MELKGWLTVKSVCCSSRIWVLEPMLGGLQLSVTSFSRHLTPSHDLCGLLNTCGITHSHQHTHACKWKKKALKTLCHDEGSFILKEAGMAEITHVYNVIYCITGFKDRSHMIGLTAVERPLTASNWTVSWCKLQRTGSRRHIPDMTKVTHNSLVDKEGWHRSCSQSSERGRWISVSSRPTRATVRPCLKTNV